MRNHRIAKILVSGAATLSLAVAGGALAQGQGNGKGNGGGNGGGNGKGQSAAPANPGKGNGSGNGSAKSNGNASRGNGNASGSTGNNGNSNIRSANAGNGNSGNARAVNAKANPGTGNSMRASANGKPGNDHRNALEGVRTVARTGHIFTSNDRLIRDKGLLDGCPPGLAKKRNGCTPPGLDRRDDYRYDDAGWWGLPGLNDGRYRYYGGNLVRLSDAGSILGYYPLLGGALSVGNVWPSWYDAEPLPSYYEEYYSLGPSYRYADNVVYRTDPGNSAITSIAALLTGSNFQVGQPMPSGYDVYNVPYGYRDRYYDSDDAYYRYSDGYVYQVDPTSQLITAAIELLT